MQNGHAVSPIVLGPLFDQPPIRFAPPEKGRIPPFETVLVFRHIRFHGCGESPEGPLCRHSFLENAARCTNGLCGWLLHCKRFCGLAMVCQYSRVSGLFT